MLSIIVGRVKPVSIQLLEARSEIRLGRKSIRTVLQKNVSAVISSGEVSTIQKLSSAILRLGMLRPGSCVNNI